MQMHHKILTKSNYLHIIQTVSAVLKIHRIFELVNGNKGKIGPHEGRIAELMLSGEKPVCNLTFPGECDQIKPLYDAARRGEMGMFKSPKPMIDSFGNEHAQYYFCQNGKEQDMQRLHELFEGDEEISTYEQWEDCTREIGAILGYSEDDINIFLKWNSSLMLQGLLWYDNTKSKLLPEKHTEPPTMDFTPLD